MKLNFFCDIDGTLLPFGRDVPQSAVRAVREAEEQGHRFYIASGRSEAEVDPRLGVIHFDGGIFSNGAKVVYRGKTVFDASFSGKDIDFLRKYGEENGFMSMIQTDEGTFMRRECRDYFIESVERSQGCSFSVPNLMVYDELPSSLPQVRKFLFISKEHRIEKAYELSKRFEVVGNSASLPPSDMVEVGMKGISKAEGIRRMMEALGESHDSVVAVGDGENDREMIEYAGLGIAMGNASEEIKKIADWVTTSIDEDGIKNAVEYAVSLKGKNKS